MNSKASGSGDVTELWGKKFNVVKNGLSEAQVVSFVNDLAKQHDILLKRQEHLGALERLAETRVIEADKLVAEMNEEAKSRCESAVAEAQVMSQKVVKEREAEAIAAARKRADEIAAEAKTLANEVINDSEAKANKIISDAAVKAREVIAQKEDEARRLADKKAEEILAKAQAEAAALLEREKERIFPVLTGFVTLFREKVLSGMKATTYQGETLAPVYEKNATGDAGPEASKAQARNGKVSDTSKPAAVSAKEAGEPDWEIDVAPPLDIAKIMSISGQLDRLPEIAITDISPRGNHASIGVYLNRPLGLVHVVAGLPEVAYAEEMGGVDGEAGKPRKISVALSGKTSGKAKSIA